jgi:anti-sigma B factor antagonist
MNPTDIIEERVNNVIVLEPQGSIDSSNAKAFGERLTTLMNEGERRLIVDFGRLTLITSAGFRALLIAGKCANQTGTNFALCNVEGKIRQLFDLGGFLDLFPIHADRASGVASPLR